ncbi:MAG: pyrroline-5-carboxylate reductase [Oscillospiraceae bacterium]|jgi:pyrroline-5-carboxylate reductase
MKKIAFIGTGNMGGALIRSVCTTIDPDEVVITDCQISKAAELAEELGCDTAEDNASAAVAAKYVVLCVKPQVLHDVLREIAPFLSEGQVLVSIAAGITMDSMYSVLLAAGKEIPMIRLLPNTPAAIGQGLILLAPDKNVSERDIASLEDILAGCGRIDRTEEKYADAIMTIGGCTPAFAYMFIEALADGAVMAGLPRQKAQEYAAQAVLGAAAMVLETGMHPGLLKDNVCSPAGSTIVGVGCLENAGFRSAAMTAVFEAYNKTVELGKPR